MDALHHNKKGNNEVAMWQSTNHSNNTHLFETLKANPDGSLIWTDEKQVEAENAFHVLNRDAKAHKSKVAKTNQKVAKTNQNQEDGTNHNETPSITLHAFVTEQKEISRIRELLLPPGNRDPILVCTLVTIMKQDEYITLPFT